MTWPLTFEPDLPRLDGAACASWPEPLWDERLHHEPAQDRAERHQRAQAICATCPVAAACIEARDPDDGGIYGGVLFHGKVRPVGRVVEPQPLGTRRPVEVEPCRSCGCDTVPDAARRRDEALRRRYRGRVGGLCGTCYAAERRPAVCGRDKRPIRGAGHARLKEAG